MSPTTDPHGTDVPADLDHPNAPEATAMNQHSPDETPDLTFSDPTADPTPAPMSTASTPPGPTGPTGPTDLTDPTASVPTNAGDTAAIPAGSTRTMPAGASAPTTPFRVEPHTPVPDDVVVPGSDLPHLPPPGAPRPDPSWAAPAAPTPAPRPVLVTVRRGPRPGAIMFGLLTMLVAAYLVVGNLTDADLSLDQVGPSMIGAFGGVLLLVGLAGVVAGRLRR